MASDRQQFARAMAHWEELKESCQFSLPPEQGHTAIISSRFTDDDPDTETGIHELVAFRNEANALADMVLEAGGRPEVAIDASYDDITRLIQDPNISNVYVIGNGSLSALILDVGVRYDWYDAALSTTNLKLGRFVQRQCGGLTRSLNVPLGLFVVSEPRNVLAAVDVDFYPTSLDDVENDKIQPVFAPGRATYKTIKDLAARPASNKSGLAESQPSELLQSNSSFLELFIDIIAVTNGEASEGQVTYIRMVKERFGLDLLDFYAMNTPLCDRIYSLTKETRAPDVDISTGTIPLIPDNWAEVYPLLIEAYDRLERVTMNAPFLARNRYVK